MGKDVGHHTMVIAPQAQASLKKTMIELRASQVDEMIAGKKFDRRLVTSTWPIASDAAIKLWEQRHPAYKSYSSHYMTAQRRLAFLIDIPAEKRFEAFEELCFKRMLAPTTAETYWTTWLGLQRALALPPSSADKRITQTMKARSVAYPVQFPQAATMNEIELVVQTFRHSLPSYAAIVMMTFVLGQRISDMIQLAAADLVVEEKFLRITVRRGKTMQVSQPYTLWLRRNSYPTESLIELKKEADRSRRLFLFSETNSDSERSQTLQIIKEMLLCVNENLELRSIRRGGLQRMAHNGEKLETIILFSRHADVKMLLRYLNWGQHANDQQASMINVVDRTTADMTTTESH